jgi:NhaP-type Na+/H+ or K+/H+ antiporter
LNASPLGSAIILAVGLFVLYIGVWLWRRCRRRSRQSRELNMSPHLMKKHD